MARFSPQQKYRFCRAVSVIGLFVELFWLTRLSPWESQHHNKFAYAGVAITVALTVPFAVAVYYYRGRLRDVQIMSGDKIAVQTLAAAGAKTDRTLVARSAQNKLIFRLR